MKSFAPIVLLAGLAAAFPAHAGVKISSKTETYRITGKTGAELMAAMDRKGPRHGFLARAIAQTRYSVEWDVAWVSESGACRVEAADVTLAISYRYPALSGPISAPLKRRWSSFLSGVRRHEETHGRLARQMVNAAQKAVARVRFKSDPGCTRAKREVSRIVKTVYAEYEAKQQQFDAREHVPGGKVDRLVTSLIARP